MVNSLFGWQTDISPTVKVIRVIESRSSLLNFCLDFLRHQTISTDENLKINGAVDEFNYFIF